MSPNDGMIAKEIIKNIRVPNTILFLMCLKLSFSFSTGPAYLSTFISSIQYASTVYIIDMTQNPLKITNGWKYSFTHDAMIQPEIPPIEKLIKCMI